MTRTRQNFTKKALISVLWNSLYYFTAVYFFLYFAIFNENKTEFGRHFLNTFYNIHIELFFLLLLVIRFSIVASKDECLQRLIWSILLICYTIACYLEAGKVTRIREVIIFGLIITASQINFKRLIQWILTFYIAVALVKIIGCLCSLGTSDGWINFLYLVKDFGRGYMQIRYQLGFGHPNALHCAFFCIGVLILYLLRRYTAKYIACAVMFVLNLILYHYTDSRMGMLIVIVTLIFYLVFPHFDKIKHTGVQLAIYLLLQILPFAAAAFTFIVGYIGLSTPFMEIVNKIFTGRLNFMHTVMTETPLTFMGTSLPVTCDSNYINTLYRCGIFVFIAYMILHVITVHYFYRKKEWTVLAIIAAFDLYYIVECTMLSMNRNVIPYFMIACSAAYCNRLPESKGSLTNHSPSSQV